VKREVWKIREKEWEEVISSLDFKDQSTWRMAKALTRSVPYNPPLR
jgi:hypothetical protein